MQPSGLITSLFPFQPTYGQQEVFKLIDTLLFSRQMDNPTMLLKGYAGTGKTTIISCLVKILPEFGYNTILLAPTGRAAKVMSSYSSKNASTIHKHIYIRESGDQDDVLKFRRRKNLMAKTVFIIDEVSMISDDAEFGQKGLLRDLVEYVFEKKSNKLILIGDGAQLPPVKKVISPALDADYLKSNFAIDLLQYELKEVVRQEKESGILFNATLLRNKIGKDAADIKFFTKGYKDIYRMTGEKLEDGLRYAYDKYGKEETIVICRSNKAATMYNEYIRRTINFSEDELSAGDILMVVRNNYTVLPEESEPGFIANGDFAEVRRIIKYEEMHGFRFANIELALLDFPQQPPFQTLIFLDTLHSHQPNLSQEEYRKLYEAVMQDYLDIPLKKNRLEAVKKDKYMSALQVKFAYALTCHKSQGGQWKAVFVEQGYLTDEAINEEFTRWLYTAVTRASQELFLVNFNSRFF